MKRLRGFLSEHRAAAAIIAAAVVAFAVWRVYAALSPGAPAVTTSAVPPVASPAPAEPPSGAGQAGTAGAPGGGLAGDAALRAAGHLTGTVAPTLPGRQPSTGAAPSGSASTGAAPAGGAPTGRATAPAAPATALAAATPPAPNTGRPDPFSPLAATGGGGGGRTNPSLPPVPPLSPGALGPSGFPAPGSPLPGAPDLSGPQGQLHLTGIVYGPVAVAILNDGAASYIVEPGDTVTPGVRIVAIDAENRSVTLASKDQSWQLRLGGGTIR